MKKTRCFVAVKVEPVNIFYKFLESIQSELNVKIKLVDPSYYHFTLHFFGDLTDEEIVLTNQCLARVQSSEFALSLQRTGSLPKNRIKKTRVLYVEPIDGANELINITNEIQKSIKLDGFQIPTRRFLPHLTIARIKFGKDIAQITQSWLDYRFNPINLNISKLFLIKSELNSSGPRYTSLYEYNLNRGEESDPLLESI